MKKNGVQQLLYAVALTNEKERTQNQMEEEPNVKEEEEGREEGIKANKNEKRNDKNTLESSCRKTCSFVYFFLSAAAALSFFFHFIGPTRYECWYCFERTHRHISPN